MPDLISRLSHEVSSKLAAFGIDRPNRKTIEAILEIAYLGTLRSEEGKFIRGSLTFADPERPDVSPPMLTRADYPTFTKFDAPKALTVQSLVKLARAIDKWSGSIAIFGSRTKGLLAWGVVDQLVQQNVRWNREAVSGFNNPGLLTVTMDGIGDISTYHGDFFLGGLKAQALVLHENDALNSKKVVEFSARAVTPFAEAIAENVKTPGGELLANLCIAWETSIARLCITLRQQATGGAFLLTPNPIEDVLDVKHGLQYSRLRDAIVLKTLDDFHLYDLKQAEEELKNTKENIPSDLLNLISFAEADADDRENEINGAVKLVASLASVDGLVLMTPTLSLIGFGVKIGSAPDVTSVYDGASFDKLKTRAKKNRSFTIWNSTWVDAQILRARP